MAEIKTCEQYVLSRMQEIENENKELHEDIVKLSAIIAQYTEAKEVLKRHIKLLSLDKDDCNRYLHMEDIDEWRSNPIAADLEVIVSVLGLTEGSAE